MNRTSAQFAARARADKERTIAARQPHPEVAAIWRHAAEAVRRYIRENGKSWRRLDQLTIEECEGLAVAAVNGYQQARADEAERDPRPVSDPFEV